MFRSEGMAAVNSDLWGNAAIISSCLNTTCSFPADEMAGRNSIRPSEEGGPGVMDSRFWPLAFRVTADVEMTANGKLSSN